MGPGKLNFDVSVSTFARKKKKSIRRAASAGMHVACHARCRASTRIRVKCQKLPCDH